MIASQSSTPEGDRLPLESLTEWILTQMSQDLVQVRKPSFSAEARLRADNWCTERFELWH
jgi:hypothetical protein